MAQEERQILLQDLCARLPYGVICNTPKGDGHLCSINQTIFGTEYGINIKATERDYFNDREEIIKPYLRPLESMAEEEKSLFLDLRNALTYQENGEYDLDDFNELQVFLNGNHFDYRGLIPMGLAIEVTEENNPYKE